MEKFSLEEYLKNPSRKVVTRGGRNARIICTDRRDYLNHHHIIALLTKSKEEEIVFYYTMDGRCSNNEHESKFDLFFVTEKHTGWINVYRNSDSGHTYAGAVYDSKEDAEKRKIIDENYVTTIKIEWEV